MHGCKRALKFGAFFYYMDRYTFSELINMKPDVRIEHPIGEIVEIQFSECKVVESDDYCDGCIFEDDLSVCVNINCCARHRKDGKNVIYQEQ